MSAALPPLPARSVLPSVAWAMAQRPGPLYWSLLGLAWLGGMALLQTAEQLPAPRQLWLELMAAIALCLASLPLRGRWLRALPAALALALLAHAQAGWRAQARLQDELAPAWEGRDIRLSGRVDSLPQQIEGLGGRPGWRFAFVVESAADAEAPAVQPLLPRRLLLSVYQQQGQRLPDLRAGQHWQLLARLRRPHGLANPHGFDHELWLFEQDLRATGVVRQWQLLAPGGWWVIDRWRQGLREAIRQRVPEPGPAGVLVALSLGEQAAISRADWDLFRATGTSHLMAISGLHITMLAWAASQAVAALWRRSPRACLRLPAPSAGLWAGVALALLYALFTGWGVPAQRTVGMLAVLALLRQSGLRWPWPLSLLASACVVCLLDPWALCQPGFWLSFVAVALLMAGGAPGLGFRARLLAALKSQWVATLGLAPLTLIFFQQLSLVGLAANLLAIPVVSLLVTPLALAGGLLPPLWSLAALLLEALLALMRLLAGLPLVVWSLAVAPAWAQGLGLLGAALAVGPLSLRLRLLALPLLLPLLWPAPLRPAPGQFELLAADVGQGTAVLLRTARHALLFDAGPAFGPKVDAGQRVLLPLLRALGQRQLDLLLLSHRDQDHVGGAAAILAGLPVRGLLSSLEPGHALLQPGLPQQACQQGQRWQWDGVQFELLHPAAADYADRSGLQSNALSCVLSVRAANGAGALLTGDIEAAQEQRLAPRLAPHDLLLTPHHGSQTSSSPALIRAVAPRLAFVQAGYRNRFGHPAPAVLARYQAAGVPVLDSPRCGALHWASATRRPLCERERAPRYWQDRPAASAAGQIGPSEPDQLP